MIKVALVIGDVSPDLAVLDTLKLTGYMLFREGSVASALVFLRLLIPQLVVVGELPTTGELGTLYATLKQNGLPVVVTACHGAARSLADRFDFSTSLRSEGKA